MAPPELKWFRREMEVLEGIRAIIQKNPSLHLITPIASYRRKVNNTGYILFPWAEGGNLKDFWDRDENKQGLVQQSNLEIALPKMIWMLKQMGGLCKALVELHKDRPREGISGGAALNCRHGDLKPENILVFQEGDTNVLRIADLGLGKFHVKSTDDRKKAYEYTKTMTGTTRYMPPEFNAEKYISRRHDVWSLGCLFIEFIIWTAWGLDGLNRFNQLDNDQFWQKRNNTRDVVHGNISMWVKNMKKALLVETALGDILRLVTSDMLKGINERSNSQKVYNKLEAIIKRSENSKIYLLGEDQRKRVKGHTLPTGESGTRNRGQEVSRLFS